MHLMQKHPEIAKASMGTSIHGNGKSIPRPAGTHPKLGHPIILDLPQGRTEDDREAFIGPGGYLFLKRRAGTNLYRLIFF